MLLSARYASTVARFGFVSLVAIASFMLLVHYELALPQPYPPGHAQRIGKQAFDVAFHRATSQQPLNGVDHAESTDSKSPGGNNDASDWDDADELEAYTPSTSVYHSDYDPFTPDSTPLTEIQFRTCVLPPAMYDMCSPTSTKKEDAIRGTWRRVDRDSNKRIGMYYAYLYYRRLVPGSSSPVITNITLLDHDPAEDELETGRGVWHRVTESVRTGIWPRLKPMYLHYQVTSQHVISAARQASATSKDAGVDLEPVTEIDVLYGNGDVQPLPGYVRIPTFISGGKDDDKAASPIGGKRVGTSLAYRKLFKKPSAPPPLRFSNEGNFTIMQVADLHFSVGPGECRDLDYKQRTTCESIGADRYSLEWLETALDTVKPSLVVLTGDQLNGHGGSSWSVQSVVMKWAPKIYERNIPWTIIFGNHDGEATDLVLEDQMKFMQKLPYFMGEPGPAGVDGVGNYVRTIRANDSDTVLTTLYFLDSHGGPNLKKRMPWQKAVYGHIEPNQINWFKGMSSQVHPIRRPYTPQEVVETNRLSGSNARPTTSKPAPERPAGGGNANYAPSGFGGGGSKGVPTRPNPPPIGLGAGELPSTKNEGDDDDGQKKMIRVNRRQKEDSTDNSGKVQAGEGSDGSEDDLDKMIDISFGQIPDDGSNIVADDPELQQSSTNELADNPLLANEKDLEPTVLPVGPTKAHPMDAKPNAITFFHVPMKASYDRTIDVGASGRRLVFGDRAEEGTITNGDSGFFEQGILSQKELLSDEKGIVDPFWDGEASAPTKGRPEVKVIANGHCHTSADCRRVNGVWLCFGGGASYSGYGQPGFLRRMRVFQLSDYGETIETYHLMDTKEIVNRTVLVGENAFGSTKA